MSLFSRIRRVAYGRRDASNASEAFRNIAQLQTTGAFAEPLPFQHPPDERIVLDARELPDELRDDLAH